MRKYHGIPKLNSAYIAEMVHFIITKTAVEAHLLLHVSNSSKYSVYFTLPWSLVV